MRQGGEWEIITRGVRETKTNHVRKKGKTESKPRGNNGGEFRMLRSS